MTGRPVARAALAPALVLGLTLALTGCVGPAGDAGGDAPSGDAAGGRARAEAVWREFAACVRRHGSPEFPDPIVRDDGSADLRGDAAGTAKEEHEDALRACQEVLRRLPASARAAASARKAGDPPSPAEVDQLRRFAQCVREHGIPEWPDPDPDGTFPLPDTLLDEGKSPRYLAAMRACEGRNPDPDRRIRVKGPSRDPKP